MTPPKTRKPHEPDRDGITSLGESLERIMAGVRARRMGPDHEPTYACQCRGKGVILVTSGRYDVGNEDRQVFAEATEDRPVAIRCPRCNSKRDA